MSSRNYFPGIGLATPNTCMGPVLDNITVSDITITNQLTANNVTVSGTLIFQNVIESLIIKTNVLEEYSLGAGVTLPDSMYLTNPTLLAGYDVYDTSGTVLRGRVSLRGTSTVYDAALRMTNEASGAFIFEGATVPYMTLFNDAGVGKMLIDRVSPNASGTVSVDSMVLGYSTAVIPGGIRYNSNTIEVCNNLGVWGPTLTAGGSIDITNRVISLASTISATNATFTNLYGDALLGVTAQSLIISPTSLLLPGALRYAMGDMQYSDGVIWKTINTTAYVSGNSISISPGGAVSLVGDIYINSIRGLTTPNTTFISLSSTDASVPHTPLQYFATARVGDTAQLIFGRDGGSYNSAVIKHNYVASSDVTNSVRVGVTGMEDIFVGYGGGYSSIRQPSIIGAGTTIEGNLGFSGGNLSVYAGGLRKNIALIDPTSDSVVSNGILATSNTSTFYPTNATAIDMMYRFSNVLGGAGTETFVIAPWATDGTVYVSTYSPSFVYRSRINNVDATPWASSIGVNGTSGVRHDYVVIGETTATIPIKGAFAMDTTGLMKTYNGSSWKFLVPMGSGKLAEANGMITSVSPTYFYPSSAVGTDQDYVFSNITGGGGKNYVIGAWETGDIAYLTSNTSSFAHRAKINNSLGTTWVASAGANGVSGVKYDYMAVGSLLATTPILGSLASDTATSWMKYFDGAAWQFLASQNSSGMITGNGLVSSMTPVSFMPTSTTAIDNIFAFSNKLDITGGQTFWVEPWASTNTIYISTESNNFEFRGRVNGTYPSVWASSAGASGVNGVLFNYMVVGSTLSTTPILGSFSTDASNKSLKFYDGTVWKYIANINTTTKMVEADGIVSSGTSVNFYPVSATAINYDYIFSNINGSTGGNNFTIGTWKTGEMVYITTTSPNFTHRATINGNPAFSWVSSLGTNGNQGIMYDYMVIGQNLGNVSTLGSFATDATATSLKFYTGSSWKYLVNMDTLTKLAEANGMVSATGSMAFKPTSTTALDSRYIFSNINGTGGQSYAIDPYVTGNHVYITSYSTNFSYRGTINGTEATTWLSSAGVNGVRYDYMLVGQNLATTPAIGSLATDATAASLKFHTGASWKYLVNMDTVTKLAEAEGMLGTSGSMTFKPTSVTALNSRYLFTNINGSGGQIYAIDPWGANDSVYLTTYSSNFYHRGKINNIEATTWMESAGTNGTSGVRHEYMLVGQTLASTPLLGSFASDITDNVMKYYNGSAWKYLTPMSTTTKRGEMQGITMTNHVFEMRPQSLDDTYFSIGNDTTTGSNGFEVHLVGTTSGSTTIRTKKEAAYFEHRIDGSAKSWALLDNNGVYIRFLILSNSQVSAPITGAVRYDGTNILVFNGTVWDTIPTVATLTPTYYNVWATISCGIAAGVPNHSLIAASNSPTFPYTNTAAVVGVDWIPLPAGYAWYFTVTIQQMAFGTQTNLRFRVIQGLYYAQIYPNIEGADTTWAAVTSGQILISVVGSVYKT